MRPAFHLLCAVLLSLNSVAQIATKAAAPTAEQRTTRYFDSIKADPQLLRAFLREFPKGGDLHNHLSGAVYAESYIAWAAEMGLCVSKTTFTYVTPKQKLKCDEPESQRPAIDAMSDPVLYRELVDALSVRNYNDAGKPGEYQFFDTFPKFNAVASQRKGDMLAELMHRAASQNEHYLEITLTIDGHPPAEAAKAVAWSDDLAETHKRLLDAGLRLKPGHYPVVDAMEARTRELLSCSAEKKDEGCKVVVRYIPEVLRAFPKEQVFAQMIWGFELAQADDRVVAINLVQPEDWLVPVRDYDLHMRMLDYLHSQYPRVHITLHAGELAFGQLKPEFLGTHLPKAIDTGHAERIGHGTDVMYYQDAQNLLREMAQKKIAVEISLSSSDLILGLRGKNHPFRQYLKAGVPVVIATDDEGVSRSDITHEYQRAVEEQGLTYADIKRISRNSLEYSFLSGTDKARMKSELEQAFAEFEKTH